MLTLNFIGDQWALRCSHDRIYTPSCARLPYYDDCSDGFYGGTDLARYCASWTDILGADICVPYYHALGNVSCSAVQTWSAFIDYHRDMSFPAGTLLLSNAMPKEHQGVAASLINTIVNYSISLSLGIAGTIEGHVNNGGQDVLKGYRGVWYLGIGLAGSGLIMSLLFGLSERKKSRTLDEKRS